MGDRNFCQKKKHFIGTMLEPSFQGVGERRWAVERVTDLPPEVDNAALHLFRVQVSGDGALPNSSEM